MPRVKRGVTARARHKKILVQAKGYRGRRKNVYRIAKQAVMKAGQYAYRDRRQRKRQFRALWIARINAAARELGMKYSTFMNGLKKAQDRGRPQGSGRSGCFRQAGICRSGQCRPRPNSAPERKRNVKKGGASLLFFRWFCGRSLCRTLIKSLARSCAAFAATDDPDTLEQVKARFLGKSGQITELLKGLGKAAARRKRLPARDQSRQGSRRDCAECASRAIRKAALEARLAEEALDVTLPGRGEARGGLHPVTRTLERIEALFRSIGFEVADGPEIEADFQNFTALNTPEDHPARSMHDTFYLQGTRRQGSRRHPAAHPYQPDPGALHAGACGSLRHLETHARNSHHCAGPCLPRRFRCNAFADVSSGRGPVDRRGRELLPT
jgi:ribosomal protein L20